MDLLTIICIKNVICLFYFGFEIIFYYKIEKALLINSLDFSFYLNKNSN